MQMKRGETSRRDRERGAAERRVRGGEEAEGWPGEEEEGGKVNERVLGGGIFLYYYKKT